jgi:hypothetical protein
MNRLLSNLEVAQRLKIPSSYIDKLLQAASLISCDFDHYGLCHYSLTLLGRKFGQYNGTKVYDVGELLDSNRLQGQLVEFDIIVWHRKIISYIKAVIEKDMLNYERLNDDCQSIGKRQYPAGNVLKTLIEMRHPATMSFHEMMTELKSHKKDCYSWNNIQC